MLSGTVSIKENKILNKCFIKTPVVIDHNFSVRFPKYIKSLFCSNTKCIHYKKVKRISRITFQKASGDSSSPQFKALSIIKTHKKLLRAIYGLNSSYLRDLQLMKSFTLGDKQSLKAFKYNRGLQEIFLNLNLDECQKAFENEDQISSLSKFSHNILRLKKLRKIIIEFKDSSRFITQGLVTRLSHHSSFMRSLEVLELIYATSTTDGILDMFKEQISQSRILEKITTLSLNIINIEAKLTDFSLFQKLARLTLKFPENYKGSYDGINSIKKLEALRSVMLKPYLNSEALSMDFFSNLELPQFVEVVQLDLINVVWWFNLEKEEESKLSSKIKQVYTKFISLFEKKDSTSTRENNDVQGQIFPEVFNREDNPFRNSRVYIQFYQKWAKLQKLKDFELKIYDFQKFGKIDHYFALPIIMQLRKLEKLSYNSGFHVKSYAFIKPMEVANLDWDLLWKGIQPSSQSLKTLHLVNQDISLANFDSGLAFPLKLQEFVLSGTIKENGQMTKLLKTLSDPEQEEVLQAYIEFVTFDSNNAFEDFLFSIATIPKNIVLQIDLQINELCNSVTDKLYNFLVNTHVEGTIQFYAHLLTTNIGGEFSNLRDLTQGSIKKNKFEFTLDSRHGSVTIYKSDRVPRGLDIDKMIYLTTFLNRLNYQVLFFHAGNYLDL